MIVIVNSRAPLLGLYGDMRWLYISVSYFEQANHITNFSGLLVCNIDVIFYLLNMEDIAKNKYRIQLRT